MNYVITPTLLFSYLVEYNIVHVDLFHYYFAIDCYRPIPTCKFALKLSNDGYKINEDLNNICENCISRIYCKYYTFRNRLLIS